MIICVGPVVGRRLLALSPGRDTGGSRFSPHLSAFEGSEGWLNQPYTERGSRAGTVRQQIEPRRADFTKR